MDLQLQELWLAYREAIGGAYVPGPSGLQIDPLVSDDDLEEIAGLSEKLTGALREVLGESPPEGFPVGPDDEPTAADEADRREHETAAFALAGLDLAIGAAVLLSTDETAVVVAERSEIPLPPSPSVEDLPPMDLLLWRASQAFGGAGAVAGGQSGPPWIIDVARPTIDGLVARGAPVAIDFGKGMLSLGVSGLASAAGVFAPLHELVDQARGRLRIGVRLLRSGLEKLGSVVGAEGFLAWIGEELLEGFGLSPGAFSSLGTRVFSRLARADRSIEEVEAIVGAGGQRADLDRLKADLDKLHHHFGEKMWWAEKAADLIRLSALVVAVAVTGPAGHLAVGVAYGIGVTVCLFATADCLDTVPGGLGWARGVPSLVRGPAQ